MGVQNLQSLQNLPNMQHGDVLEKLKMQVREMKVGLMVSSAVRNYLTIDPLTRNLFSTGSRLSTSLIQFITHTTKHIIHIATKYKSQSTTKSQSTVTKWVFIYSTECSTCQRR